jgi:hypothetical protein
LYLRKFMQSCAGGENAALALVARVRWRECMNERDFADFGVAPRRKSRNIWAVIAERRLMT